MTDSQSSILNPQSPRVVGAMVGLAVGDALGAPVAGWPKERIQQRLGSVDDYVDTGRMPGLYTGRTQQALCLLDTLLEEGHFDPIALAAKFVQLSKALHQKWPIYGAFRATSRGFRDAVDALAEGQPWDQAGSLSAANDPAVRVIPLALWSRQRRVVEVREDIIRSAWLTHRDPRAAAGALAIGYAILHLVNLPSAARFEVGPFLREIREFTHAGEAYLIKRYWTAELGLPRDAVHDLSTVLKHAEGWLSYSMPALTDHIARAARPLSDRRVDAMSPFTIASVTMALQMLARFADAPSDGLLTVVNLGGDTSGVGALLGAMLGALHGERGLPSRWLDRLQNREALRQRALALAEGVALPADAPKLARREAALTEAEMPRLKAAREGDEGEA